MLGFILSKLNLLILVVAIFAIISFFTFGLIDIIKVYDGRLLLDQLASKSFALVSSPSYCFSDSFDFPRSIIVGGEEFLYIVKVSTEDITVNVGGMDQDVTIVIFSLIPRVEYMRYLRGEISKEPPSVAASAFRTNADVSLYSREYAEEGYGTLEAREKEEIFVDPNTRIPYNSIEFRKEIRNGQEFVYFYPCSITINTCDTIKQEVACEVFSCTTPGSVDFQC